MIAVLALADHDGDLPRARVAKAVEVTARQPRDAGLEIEIDRGVDPRVVRVRLDAPLAEKLRIAKREMQRLGALRRLDRPHRQKLRLGERGLLAIQRPSARERVNSARRARRGALQAAFAREIHAARRLRNRRKQGGFGPGEVLDGLIEIETRRMRRAVAAGAIGRKPQIMQEHRLASMTRDERDRRHRLFELADEPARPWLLHARDLHRDRRAALARTTPQEVAPGCARHRQPIDARMLVKATVLERERRERQTLRDFLERPIAVAETFGAVRNLC